MSQNNYTFQDYLQGVPNNAIEENGYDTNIPFSEMKQIRQYQIIKTYEIVQLQIQHIKAVFEASTKRQ